MAHIASPSVGFATAEQVPSGAHPATRVCRVGVRVAVLMSWQERLGSLRTLGCHELALRAGLLMLAAADGDHHTASQAVHASAEAKSSAAAALASGPWPGQGGSADAAAVSQALISLLKGHIAAVLARSTAPGDDQVCHVLVITAKNHHQDDNHSFQCLFSAGMHSLFAPMTQEATRNAGWKRRTRGCRSGPRAEALRPVERP